MMNIDFSIPASEKNYNSFIYIWFNKITRMFYIGKHTGSINDGYVCSSKKMKYEYGKNPSYFKRRILEYVIDTTGNDVLQAELKWMSFIEDEELGNRYYNLKNKNFGNTCGYKKSYIWNKGLTRGQQE